MRAFPGTVRRKAGSRVIVPWVESRASERDPGRASLALRDCGSLRYSLEVKVSDLKFPSNRSVDVWLQFFWRVSLDSDFLNKKLCDHRDRHTDAVPFQGSPGEAWQLFHCSCTSQNTVLLSLASLRALSGAVCPTVEPALPVPQSC